jgi:dTDP-4-amino-4,6-dideoxygalactose transaminase
MEERDSLIYFLRKLGIESVFHYLPLHESNYYRSNYKSVVLPITEQYSRRLLRLPLYFSLDKEGARKVIEGIYSFFDLRFQGGAL